MTRDLHNLATYRNNPQDKSEEKHVMPALAPGEKVLVPIEAKAGAFPGEKLVTVRTEKGPISGFARSDFVVDMGDGTYLVAEVKRVMEDTMTVRLFGSFFTTTGLADIRKNVARPSVIRRSAAG